MTTAFDTLAHLARLNEDALRDRAAVASPDEADALIDRASERASQVEQLRALDRPAGAVARALPPAAHSPANVEESDVALGEACRQLLAAGDLSADARTLLGRIVATCR